MQSEAMIHQTVNVGVSLLIAVILLRISFYHLHKLNKNGCQEKCNQSLGTYTSILYVEAFVLFAISVLYIWGIMYTKKTSKTMKVVMGSPTLWGLIAANMALLVYGLTVNGMQATTLHKLRKCDCVKKTDADLTTFVYFERVVKFTVGLITAAVLMAITLYMVRKDMI